MSIIEKNSIKFYHYFIFAILRIIFIEIDQNEILKRKYYPDKRLDFCEIDGIEKNEEDVLIERAKYSFEIENKRNDRLTDKAKVLLGLATFSITIFSGFYGKILRNELIIFLTILFALCIIFCIGLCLNFLSVSTIMKPTFNKNQNDETITKFDLSQDSKNISFIKDLIQSQDNNSRSNDYLADIYRAAQRYYLLSFISLTLILINQPFIVDAKAPDKTSKYFSGISRQIDRLINVIEHKDCESVVIIPKKNIERTKLIKTFRLYFQFDKFVLDDSQKKLIELSLKSIPIERKKFLITGCSDIVGSRSYNKLLSENRAASVSDWLITKYHISPNQIEILNNIECSSEKLNKKNRKVMIHIYDNYF